jgi:Carboxypeptidase regulatory-like domain/TonB dependent receptor-like, beta-barrel
VLTSRHSYLLWLFVLATIATLSGQYTNATLGGIVTDSSAAAVADAKVIIQNQDVGLTKTNVTGPDGSFLFPALPIGSYKITVSKPGFREYVRSGVVLVVSQTANVQVSLQVGEMQQQVTVSADAELLTTKSASAGQLIDQKRIIELPLNGRDMSSLLYLAPGTVNETGKYCLVNCQGGVYPGESDGNVSGGGPRAVNFQMDGAGHNDTYLNTNLPFPNPDAVQEFNMTTDNLSAEYGIGAGAVVNVITKSGTNSLHGDLFEFLRNGDLNARNFFAPVHDTLKRNQFGGSAGGPILKDKLFFFGTYQGTRIRSSAAGKISFVPTAAERAGDFSVIPTPLKDPKTGAVYPNNQIPVSQFSAPSLFFLKTIPLPNGPNGQLTYAGPRQPQNDDQYLGKIDYLRGKHRISGSFFRTYFNEPPDIADAQVNILAADNGGNQVWIKNLAVNHTYSVTPNLLFNTWFGWDSQTGGSRSGAPYPFSAAGINIAAPTPPELVVSVSGFFSVSTNHLGNFDRGDYTFRENVTLQRGAHELHFGGEATRVFNNLVNTFTMSGQFTFGNQLSGNNLSDFMLGSASAFLQGGGEFKRLVGTLWSLYVQDNWRINQQLTLNIGLRWDPYFPYTEQDGRVVCFSPGQKSQRFPNAPAGLLYGGSNADPGCPAQTGSLPNRANFAPRVGFAYRIGATGKTVIRGGAGLYFTPPGNHDSNGLVDTAPFGPRFNPTGILSFQDPFASAGISNPFPQQYGPTLPGSNAQFTLPVAVYGTIQHDWHMPELATWNLTVERQLARDLVVRAAYAGNKGTYIASGVQGFREQNPAVYIPGQSTSANTQQRRLYPQLGPVGLFSSDNNSHYHSLQLNLEKRFARGFTVLANYTWAKLIDNIGPSGTTNPFNRRMDYGISNDDIPHVIHFSGLWQIPHPNVHGPASRLVNGWELTAITLWRSGFPFTVTSGVDNSFSGVGADRADFLGGKASLDPDRSHGQLIAQYFNTALFVRNAAGTFGNEGKGILRAPGVFSTDLGVLKNTRITERVNTQFRAEFFNAFNNVNFSGPSASLSSSSFGRITSAGDPRILQFALKLIF